MDRVAGHIHDRLIHIAEPFFEVKLLGKIERNHIPVGADRQIREQRKVEEQDKILPEKKQVPVGKITLLAVGALVTASVVYHSQFNG